MLLRRGKDTADSSWTAENGPQCPGQDPVGVRPQVDRRDDPHLHRDLPRVPVNIIAQRQRKNLSYAQLSRKLKEAARAIPELRLRRIEDGDRRHVDDLMALAGALDLSPITLLMPETAKRNDLVEVTGRLLESTENVWDWLRAIHLRRGALALNLRRRGPHVDEIDSQSFVASNPTWAVSDSSPPSICNPKPTVAATIESYETSTGAKRYMVRCLDTVRRLMMTPCWLSSKAIRDADHFRVRRRTSICATTWVDVAVGW